MLGPLLWSELGKSYLNTQPTRPLHNLQKISWHSSRAGSFFHRDQDVWARKSILSISRGLACLESPNPSPSEDVA